jgi:hypothetical protein
MRTGDGGTAVSSALSKWRQRRVALVAWRGRPLNRGRQHGCGITHTPASGSGVSGAEADGGQRRTPEKSREQADMWTMLDF